MVGFMIFLCIVFLTLTVFLIAKFAVKQKDGYEYVSDNTYVSEEKQKKWKIKQNKIYKSEMSIRSFLIFFYKFNIIIVWNLNW